MGELNALLAALCGDSGAARFDPAQMHAPGSAFLVARDVLGQAQACGALRLLPDGPPGTAEIKRMYARTRGRGIGAALLAALLDEARRQGYRRVWLETRRSNARALAFYRRQGFAEIPGYGHYAGREDAVCLGLAL
ncbi:GNAT family N-acetyltransferase [Mitsuaria sp. WAJ17]|nr:GNAT family N-acetyltransferase [Mitsuaria sp. WAJ17]